MSVRSITDLGVARLPQARAQTAPDDGSPAGPPTAPTPATRSGDRQLGSWNDALTSAIPTETLTPYATLIAIVAGVGDHDRFIPLRWWIYFVFIAITAASVLFSFRTKLNELDPVHPGEAAQTVVRKSMALTAGTAVLAAGAWGLVMPGSALSATLTGDTAAVTAATITIGAGTALTFLANALSKPAGTTP